MNALDAPSLDRAMDLAIECAMRFRGSVEPNPMVGCTLLDTNGNVLAVAAHEKPGTPHAEPNAIAAARAAGQDVAGTTAVVTLEPCCHTNKRTPPCVPTLIKAGIARVAVGAVDPNPDVNGKGLAQLREASIQIVTGVREPACQQLLAPFKSTLAGRPYVTLKWAESADSFVAGVGGRRVQITSAPANHAVHQLRSRCDAVAVGMRTVSNDDPLLTARVEHSPRPQRSVIFTRSLQLPPNTRLLTDPARNPLLIYHFSATSTQTRPSELAEVVRVESLSAAMADLGRRGVTHLLVEPGPTLGAAFMQANLADRLWVFQSPTMLKNGLSATARSTDFVEVGRRAIGPDVLVEYLNTASHVFAAAQSSADFYLAADG